MINAIKLILQVPPFPGPWYSILHLVCEAQPCSDCAVPGGDPLNFGEIVRSKLYCSKRCSNIGVSLKYVAPYELMNSTVYEIF